MCAKEISVDAAPAALSALNGISTLEEEQDGDRTFLKRSFPLSPGWLLTRANISGEVRQSFSSGGANNRRSVDWPKTSRDQKMESLEVRIPPQK